MEYATKRIWKMLLLLFALAIAAFSFLYTYNLARKLQEEERKNMEIWANAVKLLTIAPIYEGDDPELDNFFSEVNNMTGEIIRKNTNIPAMLVDEQSRIISWVNFDSAHAASDTAYLNKKLRQLQATQSPIVEQYQEGAKNFIFYEDSLLLSQLIYYPLLQGILIGLFLLVSYLAFNSSRKSEQNRVWVGMARETAHQLGTPISSMIAWMELMPQTPDNEDIIPELKNDIDRLQTITDRFSKIGSSPKLEPHDMGELIRGSIHYFSKRSGQHVHFSSKIPENSNLVAMISKPLMEWVIENLVKNGIDAMEGAGKISFELSATAQRVMIDVSDTGKGMPKSHFKTIFKPGFTTKKRGWGLGLSLARRIVEEYHRGKIFVKESSPGVGTTFRIVIERNIAS